MIRSTLAVTVLLVCALSANAAPVLINFDTLPGGGPLANNSVLTTQYSTWGVTFAGFENSLTVSQPIASSVYSAFHGGAPVSGQVLLNRDINDNRGDLIAINFLTPASGIEFDFLPFGGSGPATLVQAFDSSNALIFSANIGGPGFTAGNWHFALPVNGVSRLTLTQPFDTWVYGVDNLQFEATAIPEPATLAVFGGIAVAGLFGYRRRNVAPTAAA